MKKLFFALALLLLMGCQKEEKIPTLMNVYYIQVQHMPDIPDSTPELWVSGNTDFDQCTSADFDSASDFQEYSIACNWLVPITDHYHLCFYDKDGSGYDYIQTISFNPEHYVGQSDFVLWGADMRIKVGCQWE